VKFAQPVWLFGALFALVVGALFVLGGVGVARATRRFGDAERVRELLTGSPVKRRAWKAVAVVMATALAFVALARPQYGRGTRLIPATNLDVVVVLDFSKSMYARDVSPSRIARAKAEVARLIHDLVGARFGAVAFAGEPIAFPLTSDGGAIAQFFRQLEPNDMPVGGTAIARALERARELISRDPKSHDHSRVILLVTDGEDLEGDPVEVARAAGQDGITVDVVQIGGRTPERIPEISPEGRVAGYRQDESGQVLTTSLSAEGEAQLGQIAQAAHGQIIRSERGATGIDTVARELKRKMTEELSERVETVYADVYAYPLGAALLLLILEVFLGETRKSKAAGAVLACFLLPFSLTASGCGWDPGHPFEREAPEVKRALEAIDAGDAGSAVGLLESYLGTGSCADGGMGLPDKVRQRPGASFDLGLVLFQIGERYGRRFGEEEVGRADAAPDPGEQELAELRSTEVECALRAVLAIANEPDVSIDLRARAHYLAGNLEFLRRQYEEAVRHYDEALKLVPGLPDGGDAVGRDAAWNRAIALVRIEDEKKRDAGHDGSPPGDGGSPNKDASDDKKPDGGSGPKDGGKNDPPKDAGDSRPEAGNQDADAPKPAPQEAGPPPSEPPPPQSGNQDERMLDMLEGAPTLQHEDAKNRAAGRRVRGMADK
jgi:Ca-activated chloride channel homolog